MFVTLKLFIKHQFHFKSGRAMKCALTPLRDPLKVSPSTISLKLNNREQAAPIPASFASSDASLVLLRQDENKH